MTKSTREIAKEVMKMSRVFFNHLASYEHHKYDAKMDDFAKLEHDLFSDCISSFVNELIMHHASIYNVNDQELSDYVHGYKLELTRELAAERGASEEELKALDDAIAAKPVDVDAKDKANE